VSTATQARSFYSTAADVPRFFARQFLVLINPLVMRWRQRGILGFPFAIAGVICASTIGVLVHTPWGYAHLFPHISEEAAFRWKPATLHLVPSMFAPALRLPLWGAILQVAVCFAAAEAILGTRLAIMFGILGHTVATITGRIFIWIGPHFIFGLPRWLSTVHDNGPSAATLTLGMLLAWKTRSWVLAALIITFVGLESRFDSGLTSDEHIMAVIFATLAYLVWHYSEILMHKFLRKQQHSLI
jgi:hypothetical protein